MRRVSIEMTSVGRLICADVVRVCSVFAVVVLHVSTDAVLSFGMIPFSDWLAANLFDGSARWAVPQFVLLSGSLLLAPSRNEGALLFFRKRSRRILIPMVFWFAFYYLWMHFRHGKPLTPSFILTTLADGGPGPHLYFFYVVLLLYALTPLIRIIIRDRRVGVIVALGFLSLGFLHSLRAFLPGVMPPAFLKLVFLSGFIGYYTAGGLLASWSGSAPKRSVLWAASAFSLFSILVGTPLLVPRIGLHNGLYFYDYFSPPCIILSLALFLLFRKAVPETEADGSGRWRTLVRERLAPAAFGIFLVHPVMIDISWQYVSFTSVGSKVVLSPWVGIPVLSVLVFCASYLFTAALGKVRLARHVVGY